jgi:ATPase subunit of ABC transporter with duplicated ATPase domains
MSPSITLSNLGWSTPDDSPVLTNLEFSFTAERIGLVGRNGVGKSTLLALIAGARMPSTGKVTVNGKIAMLRQAVQVDAGETIADLFGAREALALLAKAEAGAATIAELEACDWTLPARIDAALADVGLDAAPDRLLSTLSGGQRTRAALAGAILAEPDFLLLDEPTNNMDAQGRATVAALLARWRGGVILVSHDRALLEAMDAIAEMMAAAGQPIAHARRPNWRRRKPTSPMRRDKQRTSPARRKSPPSASSAATRRGRAKAQRAICRAS